MILREELDIVKNILNLHNDIINLETLYEVLTAIKEDDSLSLLKIILNLSNSNIDLHLINNVFNAIKHNKELEDDILDSFSINQYNAKHALINAVNNLDILNKDSTVVIWGCWYGSILIPALAKKVKKIIGIDLNEKVIRIAKNDFFNDYKNVDFVVDDVFTTYRNLYLDTNLIINTSCEHMKPMKEWQWFQSGAIDGDIESNKMFRTPKLSNNCWFAFQSNNMFGIEGHVNCVNSIDEFKDQLPNRAEVLYQEEIEDTRGTRYMLVGKFNPTSPY